MVKTRCPHSECGRGFQVQPELVGRQAHCPACGRSLVIQAIPDGIGAVAPAGANSPSSPNPSTLAQPTVSTGPSATVGESPGDGPATLLVWPIAVVAVGLFALALYFNWLGDPGRRGDGTVDVLIFWQCIAFLTFIGVLIGALFRAALARRAGLVFGPIASGASLLFTVASVRQLSSEGLFFSLLAVSVSAVLPFLWLHRSVKRYFRVTCPRCDSDQVAADSFTMAERRCLACGSVFTSAGHILRTVPQFAQMSPNYVSAPTQPASYAAQTPAVDATGALLFGYAGHHHPTGFGGTPGRTRDVRWYVVVSIVAVAPGVAGFALSVVDAFSVATRPGINPATSPVNPILGAVLTWVALLADLALFIVWLIWVYGVHKEMRNYTGYAYPISPGKALGYCFIPFYNLYWVVYMPYHLARTVAAWVVQPRSVVPSTGAVAAYQALSIVPGGCVAGLPALFRGLAMLSIQRGLNELWNRARVSATQTPAAPLASPLEPQSASAAVMPVAANPQAAVAPYVPMIPGRSPDKVETWLLPVGRSGLAIAAGYLGLFTLFGGFVGPIALVVSLLALRELNRSPRLLGRGRAIFGLIMGLIGSGLLFVLLVTWLSENR